MVDLVAPFEAANAFVDLVANRAARQAAAGAETAVVAKHAAAGGHRAIDVGAGESGVEADLLDPLAESVGASNDCRRNNAARQHANRAVTVGAS